MSDIHEIEMSIAHAKELIERKNNVIKLTANKEFKKIIVDGYFKDEAVRLAGLTADPVIKDHREEVFLALQGISLLRQHLQTIIRMGDMAEAELADFEETLEETREQEEELV